jgi:hypothetical protein
MRERPSWNRVVRERLDERPVQPPARRSRVLLDVCVQHELVDREGVHRKARFRVFQRQTIIVASASSHTSGLLLCGKPLRVAAPCRD